MKTILHVITSMDPQTGGPAQVIRNSVFYLEQLHLNNEVVCLDPEEVTYPMNDLFTIYKLGRGKSAFQYSSKLDQWLLQHISRYDAVVVHGIWQYHNYAVYKAVKKLKARKAKVPKVVIMPHGMLDPYFQKSKTRRMKALRNKIVWQLTERKSINAADALFFTCEEELLLARMAFKGYRPKQELDVGLGIQSPPAFVPEMKNEFLQKCPDIGKGYWLFLSRIHEKKGVDILIDAYSKISSKYPKVPDLVIAGPKDSEYARQMMEKAKTNEKIHFTGMLNGASKWGGFYGCKAYILPSHQENFGIAIVEALACRKPVVITKKVNIWREIADGNGGLVLEEADSNLLYGAFERLYQMKESDLESMESNAYNTFKEKFSIEERAAVFAKTIDAICKVVTD
ncbi:glycosyltransferase [Olivibacter sp. SDN3]|uniref:glycosyltransferase n=1 Tax=Olivibacter sp. SDN3 TaxID=2764720 RepID=UPI0016510474|nr:glycosyltransferase [Olivibacter sp. SDN3]QNL51633.1 glycosyltransferase [Olivibacter sp. SDN3]